eukprot:10146091-Heterocapsa_arctica.AAC.1
MAFVPGVDSRLASSLFRAILQLGFNRGKHRIQGPNYPSRVSKNPRDPRQLARERLQPFEADHLLVFKGNQIALKFNEHSLRNL